MKKTPLVSIIVPTLNEEKGILFFLKQLQFFRAQCEIILVDGGSADNTCDLAKEYVDILIHELPGRAIQMNAGAKQASAETLLFLHADSFLPRDALKYIYRGQKQGYQWGRFDIRLLSTKWLLSLVSWFINQRSALTGIATGDQAIFVDKTLFERVGGYQAIPLMEDIALSIRLKKVAKPYRIQSKVATSARRWIDVGIVKTVLLMWWLRLLFFVGVTPEKLAVLYREGRFWK